MIGLFCEFSNKGIPKELLASGPVFLFFMYFLIIITVTIITISNPPKLEATIIIINFIGFGGGEKVLGGLNLPND